MLFVHRNRDLEGLPPEEENKALIIIGKQRNGETGEVPLAWVPQYAKFENLEVRLPSNIHYIADGDTDDAPF